MSSAVPSRMALVKAMTERKTNVRLQSKTTAVPVVRKTLPKKTKKASRVEDATSQNAKLNHMLEKLTAMRSEQHMLAGRAREKLHHALAEVCAGAHQLRSSARLFEAFCEHEFWDENPKARPRPEDRDRATRFIFRWYCGPGDAASKRASFYATQVQDFDLGPEPGPWFDLFNSRGGITKIRPTLILPERRKSATTKTASPSAVEPNDSDGEELNFQPAKAKNRPNKCPELAVPADKTLLVEFDPTRHLLVELPDLLMQKAMINGAGNFTFAITGRVEGNNGEFRKYKADHLKLRRE